MKMAWEWSTTSLLSFYYTFSTSVMILRSIIQQTIPERIRDHIADTFSGVYSSIFSTTFTAVVEDRWQGDLHNATFRAVQAYLPTRIGPSMTRLALGHSESSNILAPAHRAAAVGATVVDNFQGIRIEWTLHQRFQKEVRWHPKMQWFELTCRKSNRDVVLETYIPHICRMADDIIKRQDGLCIFTYSRAYGEWESTVFRHPSTFQTLAMEQEQKQGIIGDLDRFVLGKEFYHSVGKAWKRGYLLNGPPGTGKSSLVAAIANHLKFNVYDLQLQSIASDSDLRTMLTATTNRSILLLEDVDCSVKSSHKRDSKEDQPKKHEKKCCDSDHDKKSKNHGVTLSGLLNFIDGLWSTCGEERIIILTTNHKEKLDPALLRPGRMDVHIHMGYWTPAGFRLLADRYLGVAEHSLFQRVENWIQKVPATPAEVAQQLMKSANDAEAALDGLIDFLKSKQKDTAEKMAKKQEEERKMKKEGEGEIREKEVSSSRPCKPQSHDSSSDDDGD